MQWIAFHEEADFETLEAARYYEERAAGLGLTFLDEIEKSAKRILENPLAYQRIGGEIRQAPMTRFPYSLLYVIESDEEISVLAVAHQKRRPGYWRDRI
jgi:plasmid stabilization system protein ParE